jgi:hypothetical protein
MKTNLPFLTTCENWPGAGRVGVGTTSNGIV